MAAFIPRSATGGGVEVGEGLPVSTPAAAGEQYYDSTNQIAYVSYDEGGGVFGWSAVNAADRTGILETANDNANGGLNGKYPSAVEQVQELDATVCAINADPFSGATVNALNDKLLRVTAVWVQRPTDLIAGVKWFHASTATYTAANNNRLGIMAPTTPGDYSALSLYASCANDANLWKPTTNTTAAKAFATPWEPNLSGFGSPFWAFVVALHCNSVVGTAPQIMHVANLGGSTYGEAFTGSPVVKLNGYVAAQTDLPATLAMAAITSYAQVPIWALYQ